MKSFKQTLRARLICICCSLILALSSITQPRLLAQEQSAAETMPSSAPSQTAGPGFRLERLKVAGGAELLTIFGALDGLPESESRAPDVPLVSVLRDTLGDADKENDRLRYIWMLTYTKPTLKQKMAAAVPFLYTKVGNKSAAGKSAPPTLMDLSATERSVWEKFFWTALQSVFLDTYGIPVKASTRTYQRNIGDYRKAHVVRALAILSLYETATGASPVFTDSEMHDIQARLMLTDKALGGLVDDIYLQRVYQKQTVETRDNRGHNWELLRQRAEAESLYFEPLELPDGSATHALLWVAKQDLAANHARKFSPRFLNFANPWTDKRLQNWEGYAETRYFDDDHRPVDKDAPGAHAVEMIPLALYGLDHPKIPILLVDFRNNSNPKKREMSHRVLEDTARNVLSLSRFGDAPYFLGRTIYDFVTGRRGMDINQPSRLRAYSQLKLLLALDSTFNPDLREEIASRMESATLNPLENSYQAEARLAREQYRALVAYAQKPEGLPAQLQRDRRAEMVSLKHSATEQALLHLANVMTFGLYTHRERETPTMLPSLDQKRRIAYHTRFLREISKPGTQIEVAHDMEEVRRSLRYVAEQGAAGSSKLARAAARIFQQTEDAETRELALQSLYRITNKRAKDELLAIYQNQKIEEKWRVLSANYLRRAVQEDKRIAPAEAKAILSVVGQ